MNEYECWIIKKAECQRIDVSELCWRRLLRVPWTARKSYQSILEEINPEYSLEGLMLKLKLQYFGHPMQRVDSLEKTLTLGKTESKRRRGWQRMGWLDGITDSMDMSLSQLQQMVKNREGWRAAVYVVAKSQTQLTEQRNKEAHIMFKCSRFSLFWNHQRPISLTWDLDPQVLWQWLQFLAVFIKERGFDILLFFLQ